MIKEKVTITYRDRFYVTKICDACGKEEKVQAYSYLRCRLYRNLGIDLCRSCANSEKRKGLRPINGEHWLWKGGISNGYKLITVRDPVTNKRKHLREHRLLYEGFLGRKLLASEIIHHIDLDKQNNSMNNLFLCLTESAHQYIHSSLEDTGFKLLGKFIWFDYRQGIYVCEPACSVKKIEIIVDGNISNRKIGKRNYSFVRDKKLKKQRLLHVLVVEKEIGRRLFRNECVHHIDGNTLNNDVNNLKLIKLSDHLKAHKSMQNCASLLYKNGFVKFDRKTSIYELSL